ncbi:MAG: multiheme c-type cytochrome, partial [Candidatus Thiodiazotropha sp.]
MLKPLLLSLTLAASLCAQSALAADETFTSSHFSGSGNCMMCHDNLQDTSGNDVSIIQDWKSSMMANASRDPFWQAKVAAELKRNGSQASVINNPCSSCHAPMANYEMTQVQGSALEIL